MIFIMSLQADDVQSWSIIEDEQLLYIISALRPTDPIAKSFCMRIQQTYEVFKLWSWTHLRDRFIQVIDDWDLVVSDRFSYPQIQYLVYVLDVKESVLKSICQDEQLLYVFSYLQPVDPSEKSFCVFVQQTYLVFQLWPWKEIRNRFLSIIDHWHLLVSDRFSASQIEYLVSVLGAKTAFLNSTSDVSVK